jgi:simple sugar transport system ATP-binding protein
MPPDRGEVRFFGQPVARPSVELAIQKRIGMVHQHFMLVDTLTVAENVVLGREPLRGLRVDLGRAMRELSALGREYGLEVEPMRQVADLSVGERQRVEILKVLWRGADVLILDEPTALLTPPEVEQLFAVLRKLTRAEKSVILVTHKLDEVMAFCQRLTVMRRGEVVARLATAETNPAELARQMVGREMKVFSPPEPHPGGRTRLEVERLTVLRADGTTALSQVSFSVAAGEVLGVASVQGNGESELGLAIAGLVPITEGRIRIDQKEMTGARVRARQRAGLGHVPEDRHARGLVLSFSVEKNVLLGREDELAPRVLVERNRLHQLTQQLLEDFDVRPRDADAIAGTLSGGNQQKVVIGRELGRQLSVLLCAQPTRGVDVGAVERIHEELRAVAKKGIAILLISSELDELFRLAHRILVLYRGKVAGIYDNAGDAAKLRVEIGRQMLGASA